MAYSPIANVSIVIQATPLTQEGFGTPLFITNHRQFQDRIREYSNLTSVGEEFGTDSEAYKAARAVFRQSPSVGSVKIGRRDGYLLVTPPDASLPDATSTSVTIEVFSETGTTLATETIAFTTTEENQPATAIVDGLVTAFGTTTLGTYLTATDDSTAMRLTLISDGDGKYFEVNGEAVELTPSYVYDETPAATLVAIEELDTDWYFVTAQDNSSAYVTAMSAELTPTRGIYFVSSADVANLVAYRADLTNTDIFATLRNNNQDRAVTFFHQGRENDDYPELAFCGANAPYDAGSVNWVNIEVVGLGASIDPVRGRVLTTTQKTNLEARNANYVEVEAGVAYIRGGKTAGGEWIDLIRGVDWLTSDMSLSLRRLLNSQKGGKLVYTDKGTAVVREVVSSSLQRAVNRNFITADFSVDIPQVSDISTLDKLARVLNGVTFSATAAGAINIINVRGTVGV